VKGDGVLLMTAVVGGLSAITMVVHMYGQMMEGKVAGGASLCRKDQVGIDGGSGPRAAWVIHFTFVVETLGWVAGMHTRDVL
jgi:hypothetical protein